MAQQVNTPKKDDDVQKLIGLAQVGMDVSKQFGGRGGGTSGDSKNLGAVDRRMKKKKTEVTKPEKSSGLPV